MNPKPPNAFPKTLTPTKPLAPVVPIATAPPVTAAPAVKAPGNGYRTVKVQDAAYARLQALLEHIGTHGWAGVGSKRGDRHTISAVIDEALAVLEARKK